ncbi:MAG: FHA domain-containing protein [Cyanobacteria bacterium P01_D01_bin.156]
MIICPNCNYQNPEGASQCEACYTPLPSLVTCPNCGAQVQADASFCGQCGYSLTPPPTVTPAASPPTSATDPAPVAELVEPDPLVPPDPLPVAPPPPLPAQPAPEVVPPVPSSSANSASEQPVITQPAAVAQTQIQRLTARLLHVQTDTLIDLPVGIDCLHIGKPNDRVPPDIDVSGFPESEIVSRVHANVLIEGDVYYIEDIGSSNGTYINNLPLAVGNRHRLRPGDRIALGKGDKVSFIFQLV